MIRMQRSPGSSCESAPPYRLTKGVATGFGFLVPVCVPVLGELMPPHILPFFKDVKGGQAFSSPWPMDNLHRPFFSACRIPCYSVISP
jgi:hypothetical protein